MWGTTGRRRARSHVGNPLGHHDEQHPAFIPPAQPANAPAINVIAKLDGPEEP
jgi:hypothetical protein